MINSEYKIVLLHAFVYVTGLEFSVPSYRFTYRQFHQHFIHAFIVQNFGAKKLQSLNVSRKKQCKDFCMNNA